MSKLTKAQATQILKDTRCGSQSAAGDLFALVYDELRALAGSCLRREQAGHTLQPTALVHEAYLRLVDVDSLGRQDRAHFLALAARVMRQVLIDHARKKRAEKRGGDWVRMALVEEPSVARDDEVDVLAVEETLKALEALDARKAKVVELRFFGGMTIEEAAVVLGVSPKTVEADWYMARAWLRAELRRKGLAPE